MAPSARYVEGIYTESSVARLAHERFAEIDPVWAQKHVPPPRKQGSARGGRNSGRRGGGVAQAYTTRPWRHLELPTPPHPAYNPRKPLRGRRGPPATLLVVIVRRRPRTMFTWAVWGRVHPCLGCKGRM